MNVEDVPIWKRCPFPIPADYVIRRGPVEGNTVVVLQSVKHGLHVAATVDGYDMIGELFNKVISKAILALGAQIMEMEYPGRFPEFLKMRIRFEDLWMSTEPYCEDWIRKLPMNLEECNKELDRRHREFLADLDKIRAKYAPPPSKSSN